MLTEAKEHVLGQDRQALLISPYKYGNMGSHNDHNGSVQHLNVEIIDADNNRNDEGVRS
jgi:hypothetical protein